MIADVHAVPLLMAILATYRVSHMITSEDGPFDVFALFRSRFNQSNWIGRGVHCTLCVSFWVSLIPMALFIWLWWLTWPIAILVWLGIAGGVVVLHKVAR
jgi:hypothetical protein